jgi:molybdenum cofactor cytidylyltransferase
MPATNRPRTFAVIPAGGKSRRMGRPKLTLPLGGRTVLEHVLGALHRAGVEQPLVVIGPHVPELVPLAEASGAQVLLLGEETADMRATVEHGLRWLEEHRQPSAADNWLLVPADHPTLDAAVVRQLLEARAAHPESSLILPTFEGRRGHPTLISWRHVAAMRALPAGQGLNVYLRQHAAETLELPVTTSAVLCDLDTPEDYERLQRTETKRSSGSDQQSRSVV